MGFHEDSITLESSGLKIAFKKWGNGPEPVIALHGWLDNAASFDPLGPFLNKSLSFYALDICGHGLSEHLPKGADYTTVEAIEQILEFAKEKEIDSFHLVGHSMGAGIASLVAGVIPRRIKSLTLIEGIGPISLEKEELPERILKHFKIKFRRLLTEKPSYKTPLEAAEDRHIKTGLPLQDAKILTRRGLILKTGSMNLTWRTDPRLLAPTAHPLCEEEVLIFLRRITAKTSLILASNSFLNDYKGLKNRTEAIKNCSIKTLDGSHHVHMEKPKETAEMIEEVCLSLN